MRDHKSFDHNRTKKRALLRHGEKKNRSIYDVRTDLYARPSERLYYSLCLTRQRPGVCSPSSDVGIYMSIKNDSDLYLANTFFHFGFFFTDFEI